MFDSRILTSFHVQSSRMGDVTGVALAGAFANNSTLKDVRILESNMGGTETGYAVMEALKQNATLQTLIMGLFNEDIWAALDEATERNRKLPAQWRTLAQLARGTRDTGFRSLKEMSFRREIFTFFLPPLYTLTPSASGMMGSTAIPMADEKGAAASSSISGSQANINAGPSAELGKDELGQALQCSAEEAIERENSDIQQALLRSKLDAPQVLSEDGVVVLTLTRHARAVE